MISLHWLSPLAAPPEVGMRGAHPDINLTVVARSTLDRLVTLMTPKATGVIRSEDKNTKFDVLWQTPIVLDPRGPPSFQHKPWWRRGQGRTFKEAAKRTRLSHVTQTRLTTLSSLGSGDFCLICLNTIKKDAMLRKVNKKCLAYAKLLIFIR